MGLSASERTKLRQHFLSVLTGAAKHRRERETLVEDAGEGSAPGWLVFERETMHEAVNAWRAEHNLPPVDISSIVRVERQASGHVDYAVKFSLYCAEIAEGLLPERTG